MIHLLTFSGKNTDNGGILVDMLDGVLDLKEATVGVEGRGSLIVP